MDFFELPKESLEVQIVWLEESAVADEEEKRQCLRCLHAMQPLAAVVGMPVVNFYFGAAALLLAASYAWAEVYLAWRGQHRKWPAGISAA